MSARTTGWLLLPFALAALVAGCGGDGDGQPTGAGATPPPGTSGGPAAGDAVRVVAPDGNDQAAGTRDAPFATVARALEGLPAGGTVVLRGGTYRENVVVSQAGTADAPIAIRAEPGERPVLQGAGDGETLEITGGAAHVVIDGIVVEGAKGPSTANVYVSGDAHDITLRACEVRGSERQGLFTERTTRAVSVEECFFHDNGGSGPENQDHNLYVEGEGHRIVNSIIVGARNGYGIQLYPVTRDARVANNTIVGNRSGIVVGADEGGSTSGNVIANNIIAFNAQTGLSTYWGDGTPGTGNVARANLLFRNGQGDVDNEAGGLTVTGSILANPGFVDRAKRDFRLRAASAASGRALPDDTPERDYLGEPRPPAADLGAIEAN